MSSDVAELERAVDGMPDDWREVAVADVVAMLPGFAFKSEHFVTDTDEGLPLIRIRDLGQTATVTRYVGGYGEAYAVQDGDVLVGMDGEFAAVRWQGGKALLNQRVLKLSTARPDVLNEGYLFYRVQPSLSELEQTIGGTTVKHLSTKDLKRLTWQLPPLDEQRRIAEVLRSVDEAIAASRHVLSQMSAAKAAERRDAFSATASATLDPGLAKQGWSSTRLGKVFRERKEKGVTGLPVASVSIEQGLVLRADLDRRVASNLPPEGHSLVRRDDIAYNMMRMWQGACGMATTDCLVSPAYVVMTPTPDLDPRFAHHMLRSEPVIGLLHAYSQGIVDDRLRLYPQAFSQIPINLPPLVIQREIAELLDAYVDGEAVAAKELSAKEAMKAALMSDLLSGRVRLPA
ncbi:restriction endonuclease subunit S [Novosphingobium subterraneum]|uniref:restriction endonuclease subunit S n=1 Tax=Novosphingobium subterraneum TaxID=48936 RepID=UPI003CFF4D91